MRPTAERRGPYVLGLDLAGGASLTAATAYWWQTGRVEAFACFPKLPTLQEREQADAVRDQLYQRLEAAGELLVMDGGDHGDQVVPVKAVLQECVRRWGRPEVLIADYHAVHELHGVMAAAGLHPNMHKASSLGWQDSPWRVRSFRRAVLAGRVHPPRSLLMRASLTGAKTQRNTGGDEKLVKARGGRGGAIRDDVAVTLMQAISEGFSRAEAHRPRRTRVTRLSA